MGNIKKILVFGCCGFIGSAFCREVAHYSDIKIIGVNRNTDQKNLKRLEIVSSHNFKLVFGSINDIDLTELFDGVDVVVNFAAKTFVDYSVRNPQPFIESNIIGVYNLLEATRKYPIKLFCQVSTDEVYGPCLNSDSPHKEDSPLNPTNPYSSTKACAEMLCLGYAQTYKIPMLITRTENVYGIFQHPQKVIPTWVRKALSNEALPIYGDGKQRRMWLRVEDKIDALLLLIKNLKTGVYNIAGGQELENIELARIILNHLGKDEKLIQFIDDSKIRPNHDRRYAIDTAKIKNELGWHPKWELHAGIEDAVDWYVQNQWWFI